MKSQADNLTISELIFLPFRYVQARVALEVDRFLKPLAPAKKDNEIKFETFDLSDNFKVDIAQPNVESSKNYVEFREIGAVTEEKDSNSSNKVSSTKSKKKKSKKKEQAQLDATANTKYENRTKKELYDRAKELDIEGRSTMSKSELIKALRTQQ